jgi:hypothetical protein
MFSPCVKCVKKMRAIFGAKYSNIFSSLFIACRCPLILLLFIVVVLLFLFVVLFSIVGSSVVVALHICEQ